MPKAKLGQCPDNLEATGAGLLARRIESHWQERGYGGIRAVRYEIPGMPGVYGVRSNIEPNGFPPRSAGLAAWDGCSVEA